VIVALFFAVLFVLFNCSKDCPKNKPSVPVTGSRSRGYDIFLAIGLLYMLLGNDLTNPLFSKMAIGERTSPDGNVAQKFLYNIHAENDPMMRSTKPVYGRDDMLPPFLTNMSYSYLILASPIEIVFIYKLFGNDTGPLPDCLQVASSAFIFRSITEIMYGGTLQFNKVAPFKGKAMTRYLIEAVPQMIHPVPHCREILWRYLRVHLQPGKIRSLPHCATDSFGVEHVDLLQVGKASPVQIFSWQMSREEDGYYRYEIVVDHCGATDPRDRYLCDYGRVDGGDQIRPSTGRVVSSNHPWLRSKVQL